MLSRDWIVRLRTEDERILTDSITTSLTKWRNGINENTEGWYDSNKVAEPTFCTFQSGSNNWNVQLTWVTCFLVSETQIKVVLTRM